MAVSLTPLIYADHPEVSLQVKAWGWKVRVGKHEYKKNEAYIDLNESDKKLWNLKIYTEQSSQLWCLRPLQIKQTLDHLICFEGKNKKSSNAKPNKQQKANIEKSLVKMGKVFFPMSFWLDFSESQNVHELLEKLFELPVFLSNAYLLLCILKKGESLATVYDYSRGRKVKKISLESEKFNAIFDHVKKNKKGYLFNMSNLSSYLNVQGYAQGGAATSSDYQVVLLVSKNELIPPTLEEIHAIKSLLPELIPWIEYTLNMENKNHRAEIYQAVAQHLPITLDLLVDSGEKQRQWTGELQEFTKDLGSLFPQKIKIKSLKTKNNSEDTYLDLNHYQRVKLLGELFNTLKHELSNPLFGLKLSQQILTPYMSDQQTLQLWKNVEINITRCEQILNSTLDLFGTNNVNQLFYLSDVISQALLLSKSKTKGLVINNQCQELPKLMGDASLILHIIFNLIINAGEHLLNKKTHEKYFQGTILIQGKLSDSKQHYELIIADNGDGVSQEVIPKLFQKFITSKPHGTGLGLSLSYKLAQKIPGELAYLGNGLILSGAHFILRINL